MGEKHFGRGERASGAGRQQSLSLGESLREIDALLLDALKIEQGLGLHIVAGRRAVGGGRWSLRRHEQSAAAEGADEKKPS